MRKILLLLLASAFIVPVMAQETAKKEKTTFIPYIGFTVGGCVANPFSALVGVQQSFKKHLVLAYDIHYQNTGYECNCEEEYSKGHYSAFTPSVKLQYFSGKKQGRGFVAGIGLGYMIARDRGYTLASKGGAESEKVYQNWDFNSIAPSFTIGGGFRLFKLPAYAGETLYFAKDTKGWGAMTGGIEFRLGLHK